MKPHHIHLILRANKAAQRLINTVLLAAGLMAFVGLCLLSLTVLSAALTPKHFLSFETLALGFVSVGSILTAWKMTKPKSED